MPIAHVEEKMSNTVLKLMSLYAHSLEDKVEEIQKVLRKMPKVFDNVEVVLQASEVGGFKFKTPLLVLDGNFFPIEAGKCPVKAVAKIVGFDLRDINAPKISDKLLAAVAVKSGEYAPGVGTKITINKTEAFFNVKMNVMNKDFEHSVYLSSEFNKSKN